MSTSPLDTLIGYRLGSRQATVELQRAGAPAIHIDFAVLGLVAQVRSQPGQAVILTGTAGDGKTYLAYQIMDALGLDRAQVMAAQRSGGYQAKGAFIDLDLSAGALSDERVRQVHDALAAPQQLSLVCANEGKLSELEERLQALGLTVPPGVLRINLSRRALASTQAWQKVLTGVLNGPLWQDFNPADSPALAWNRNSLQDPAIAERLRLYLLLPYLLGEPITVRETLSFLAHALGGGLDAASAAALPEPERIRYLLFNTLFSEPEGFQHGGRAAPNEKLLWWLYRFDPADRASPEMDLNLLIKLNGMPDAAPPPELLHIWQNELIVQGDEDSDSGYRQRLSRFMRYARRWYALSSDQGFEAYFPFRYFADYLQALSSPVDELSKRIPRLLKGLNMLLSGGSVEDDLDLKLFYLPVEGGRSGQVVYSTNAEIDESDLELLPDTLLESEEFDRSQIYLEQLPRRLYLRHATHPHVRLPISLMLYEVLMGAGSPQGGFPATLWAKERETVARFIASLNHTQKQSSSAIRLAIALGSEQTLRLNCNLSHKKIQVT